jgi:hypothetical protein
MSGIGEAEKRARVRAAKATELDAAVKDAGAPAENGGKVSPSVSATSGDTAPAAE